MYGAFWCSHCNNQKQALGREVYDDHMFQYIECDKVRQRTLDLTYVQIHSYVHHQSSIPTVCQYIPLWFTFSDSQTLYTSHTLTDTLITLLSPCNIHLKIPCNTLTLSYPLTGRTQSAICNMCIEKDPRISYMGNTRQILPWGKGRWWIEKHTRWCWCTLVGILWHSNPCCIISALY